MSQSNHFAGSGTKRARPEEIMQEFARHRGSVKFFDQKRGFGFLRSEDDGAEFFVHATGIWDDGETVGSPSLSEGALVEFSICESERGWQAFDVVALDWENFIQTVAPLK